MQTSYALKPLLTHAINVFKKITIFFNFCVLLDSRPITKYHSMIGIAFSYASLCNFFCIIVSFGTRLGVCC